MHSALTLALAGLTFVVFLLAARRLRGGDDVPLVFGPWLLYDIVRTARRSRLFLFRSVFLAALLGALLLIQQIWWNEISGAPQPLFRGLFTPLPLERDRVPELAQSVFWTFLMVQLAAVFLLTPIATAGALADERRTGSLDLLLTTDLRDHEIVFGVFIARVSTILLLVLAGLPVFSFLQFLGGIDPTWVFLGFLGTIACALICGACGIFAERLVPTQFGALFLTYVLTGAVLYGSVYISAFGMLFGMLFKKALDIDFPYLFLFANAIFIAGIVWTILILAMKRIRAGKQSERSGQVQDMHPVVSRPGLAEFAHGSAVVFWKDRSWRISRVELGGIVLFFGLLGPLIVALGLVLDVGIQRVLDAINVLMCVLAPFPTSALFLSIGLSAAARFSREREMHTLDSLLTTPLTRLEIYRGKWLASFLSLHPVTWLLPGIGWPLASFFSQRIINLPFVLIILTASAAFSASLGLYCSAVCRTTVRATVWTASIILMLQIVPLLFPGMASFSPAIALFQVCVTSSFYTPNPMTLFLVVFVEQPALILVTVLLARLTYRWLQSGAIT